MWISNIPLTQGLNDHLRKYIKGAYIESVEVVNDDRILKFNLYKSDEFYEKQSYTLILELIPTINNLILLNSNDEIIFAKHYSDLTASRPIIKGMKYSPINKNTSMSRGSFDYEKYSQEIRDYVVESDHKKQKEQVLPLYNHLKQKEKSLKKKLKVLEEEKEQAQKNFIYKEYGEYILTYSNSLKELNEYIDTIKDQYDTSISPNKNAENFFNKYKKAKRTIENVDREIIKGHHDLEEISHYLATFDYLANEYHLADTTVRHFCNLADRHGTDILRRSKKKTYSNQFKLNAINRVLIGHESSKSVAVDLGLSCNGMVTTWIKSYIENGYNIVTKKKGRPSTRDKGKEDTRGAGEGERRTSRATVEEDYRGRIVELLKKLQALAQEEEKKKKSN